MFQIRLDIFFINLLYIYIYISPLQRGFFTNSAGDLLPDFLGGLYIFYNLVIMFSLM